MKKHHVMICAALVLTLLVTGCSDKGDDTYERYNRMPTTMIDPSTEMNENASQTLTIWTMVGTPVLEFFARSYMADHPGDVIEIINKRDSSDSYYDILTAISTALASGLAPDILDAESLPIHQYIRSGILTDLNLLIEEDQSFDRSRYFDNILRACEIDGMLPLFPTHFCMTLVSMNKNVHPESYQEFMDSPSVDMYQVERWFSRELAENPREPYLVGTNVLQEAIKYWEWFDFFDIRTRTVRFHTPEFEQYLSTMDTLWNQTHPWRSNPDRPIFEPGGSYAQTVLLDYAFYPTLHLQRLMEYPSDCFSPPRSFTSTEGKIYADLLVGFKFSIPSISTQKELAWDVIKTFVDFTTTSIATPEDRTAYAVNRERCMFTLQERILPVLLQSAPKLDNQKDAAAKAVAELIHMIERVNYITFKDPLFSQTLHDYLSQYLRGEIDTHQAIGFMQQRGELYMYE